MYKETSIYFSKDFTVPKQLKDWHYISTDTINKSVSHFQSSSASKSCYAEGIATFFTEARKRITTILPISQNGCIAFNINDLKIDDIQQAFRVAFHPEFLKLIGQVSPKYFIRVIVTAKYVGIADKVVYDRRMDGTEALQGSYTEKNWLTLTVFSSAVPFEEDFSADVIVGWYGETVSMNINTMSQVMKNIFENDSTKDLTIKAGNGAEVKCHKIIFEAHSNVFAAMLASENGMLESQTSVIEMRENSQEGITQFIKYLYGLEVNIGALSCHVTVELFKLAHKYEVLDLHDCIGKFLLEKESDWFNPPDVLVDLYFVVRNLDEWKKLQDHTMTMILKLSLEVRNCERLRELKKTEPEASHEFVWALVDFSNRSNKD